MSHHSQSALLERVLAPAENAMTPEAAHWLVGLRPDPELEARLGEYADRNTARLLTPDERAEYEATVMLGDCIALLQSRARKLLGDSSR